MFNERTKSTFLFLLALTAGMFATPAIAQDDLYYDPATDAPKPVQVVVVQDAPQGANNVTRIYSEDGYSDDDYAYEYSSRIRRFHQPTGATDYYDPLYVDMFYYDPFYSPGTSIYVGGYNDYWQWRSWNRWQFANPYAFGPMYGWNSFGYSPWGWNSGFNVGWGFGGGFGGGWGYPSWGYPGVYNNFFYDPYWAWNGYNPYYCPGNVWVTNNYYNNGYYGDNGNFPETYYGPRRGNTTTVDPGFQSANKYKDGRLAPAPNPNGDPERVKNTTASGRKIESDREPATDVQRQTSTSKDAGRPETPATVTPSRRPQTETDVKTAPSTRPQTETRQPTNVEPTRRPQTETEVRPTEPTRRPQTESQQPTNVTPTRRPQSESTTRPETRPSRRPESAPTQTRTEERPSRNNNRDIPTNTPPSRNETRSESRNESRSFDRPSSPSTRSNDGGGSGRSSGGNSGGSSGRSSSGGGSPRSGGRN